MIGTLKGTVFICTFAIASATASNARAAHATNFLNSLQDEVTNRIAAAGTNSADKRALEIANKALNRNSKTFAADLGILANAATALNVRFSDDGTLIALEEEALAAYELEAEAQILDAYERIGTNSIPKGLSNQLNTAQSTLTNLIVSSNSLPDRARALAKVFNKLRNPIAQVTKKYKGADKPDKPNEPFTAPGTLRGKNLDLVETAIVNEQTKFYFHSTVQNELGQTVDNFSYVTDNP
jgi:hypothetical protein